MHQGVQFSNSEERVLYLNDQDSISKADRRNMLDHLNALNHMNYEDIQDPEIKNKNRAI